MMLKKMVLLFILLNGLMLMACASNDDLEQSNYEGVGDTWRAELEYQEEVIDEGQINAEIDLVISYNGALGEYETADEISYRLELEDTIVFENSESYDETEEVSALYVLDDAVIENSFPNGSRIVLEVEWDGKIEEFQLDRIEEE